MNLFNLLPDGCFHLESYCNRKMQEAMVDHVRRLSTTHPFVRPQTAKGYPMALSVTSWGKAGWFGERGRYSYWTHHPRNNREWLPIPRLITNILNEALIVSKLKPIDFETVLVNHYPAGTGRLGKHQDITEQDHESPIVTISLGATALFRIGNEEYDAAYQELMLRSGDIFVMSGASRLAYHEVANVQQGSSDLLKDGGRLSLTGRRIYR